MVVASSNLEVDVNGEEIFLVDKKLVSSFASRLHKLFGKSIGTLKNLKVIFHDFPGGAECFELIARFCYSHGRIEITPSNVFSLHCAAIYMEMKTDSYGMPNLIDQTEAYMEKIHFWALSELIVALKQCQDLFESINSTRIQELLNSLVGKLTLPCIDSPFTSSSESSSCQFSGEINTENSRSSKFQTTWWFEDLVFLNIDLFERLINTMLSHNFDQFAICSFLFYYQKLRFHAASPADKCKITETVINMLCLLDGSYIACKRLLGTFGMAFSLKLSKSCKVKLESLVGSWLNQATIDDLLVRSPRGKKYAYDVNLIIQLVKYFLYESSKRFSLDRLKKVAGLIDSYLAEVAPDPYLRPSKFVALASALPDFARESYDRIYQAMDMYLEVHYGLCEEEKMRIYSTMNYNRISPLTLKHLAQNVKFPLGFTVFVSQHISHLKEVDTRKTFGATSFCHTRKCDNVAEKILLRAKRLDFTTDKMQLKECTGQRLSVPSNVRSLMRLF